MTWTVDGTPSTSGRAGAVDPRGAIHRFDNNGSQDAKALCLITPAAIGPQFFREAAEVIDRAAGGPPDRAKMAEIMRRHGLTPLRPRPRRSLPGAGPARGTFTPPPRHSLTGPAGALYLSLITRARY